MNSENAKCERALNIYTFKNVSKLTLNNTIIFWLDQFHAAGQLYNENSDSHVMCMIYQHNSVQIFCKNRLCNFNNLLRRFYCIMKNVHEWVIPHFPQLAGGGLSAGVEVAWQGTILQPRG